MKMFQLIKNVNSVREFVAKNYELPFSLRRAIKKNEKAMIEEYVIFDEERNRIRTSDIDDEEKKQKEVKMLNEELDIEIIKLPIEILADINMTLADEELISFMLEEEV